DVLARSPTAPVGRRREELPHDLDVDEGRVGTDGDGAVVGHDDSVPTASAHLVAGGERRWVGSLTSAAACPPKPSARAQGVDVALPPLTPEQRAAALAKAAVARRER